MKALSDQNQRLLTTAVSQYGNSPYFAAEQNRKKPTKRVQRRRRGTADGPRERAQAPRRNRPTASRPRPTSSGGGSISRPPSNSGGSIQLPGGGQNPLLIIGVIILLVVCVFPLMSIFGGDSSDNEPFVPSDSQTNPNQTIQEARPTNTPVPFVPPVSTGNEGQTWLIMLYQDADDKILEQDIYVDLNEAEKIGSSDQVHIVAQIDRFRAGYQGDGDWSTAKRFYVTTDDSLQQVRSQEIQDLGEVNMADGQTLVDFVVWAAETFPADKHVLIMSDHGIGWPGGWSDPDPGPNGSSIDASIPLASALGDELYLMELDQALADIRAQTSIEQFELIGMDACLMGHIEVFTALAPHARYAVASQEVEPALGWAYAGFLGELSRNPGMSGADLGRFIVDTYIREDERIVDDQARAEMLQRGSPMGGLFGALFGGGGTAISAEQLAQQMGQGVTLTAVDLATMPALLQSLNDLAFVLQDGNQRNVAQARTHAQSFTSVFGNQVPPAYIDLGNFVQIIQQQSPDRTITQAGDAVLAAINNTVIAEKHGPKKPGANGISIYFPNSQLYRSPVTGPQSYTAVSRRFADTSLWDDFLAYHYAGRRFEQTTNTLVVPERADIVAPGAEAITISSLSLSSNVASPDQPVLLSADISGQNIGYVYLFVGFYDQASNAIFVADSDYLESDLTREVEGIYYPDWGDDPEFTMEFEWEPIVFAIDDGVNTVTALFSPESYGLSFEEAVYTVEGIYTFADGGRTRYSRLYFVDGLLRQVYGFTGEDGLGAPREIIPQAGDQFTILNEWLDLDSQGNVVDTVQLEGGTLTFSEVPFTWIDLNAAAGEYLVGFIVEDLDGNQYEAYQQITVE